jgi:hypothetical protein
MVGDGYFTSHGQRCVSTDLASDMMPDVKLFVVSKLAIHSFDSGIGCLNCLVMNETVSFRVTVFVGGNLAGEDISESGKCIVKTLSNI